MARNYGGEEVVEKYDQAVIEQLRAAVAKSHGTTAETVNMSPAEVIAAAQEAGLIDRAELEALYEENHPPADTGVGAPQGLPSATPAAEMSTLELYIDSKHREALDSNDTLDSSSPNDLATQLNNVYAQDYHREREMVNSLIADRHDVDDPSALSDEEAVAKAEEELEKQRIGDTSGHDLTTVMAQKVGEMTHQLTEKYGFDRSDLDGLDYHGLLDLLADSQTMGGKDQQQEYYETVVQGRTDVIDSGTMTFGELRSMAQEELAKQREADGDSADSTGGTDTDGAPVDPAAATDGSAGQTGAAPPPTEETPDQASSGPAPSDQASGGETRQEQPTPTQASSGSERDEQASSGQASSSGQAGSSGQTSTGQATSSGQAPSGHATSGQATSGQATSGQATSGDAVEDTSGASNAAQGSAADSTASSSSNNPAPPAEAIPLGPAGEYTVVAVVSGDSTFYRSDDGRWFDANGDQVIDADVVADLESYYDGPPEGGDLGTQQATGAASPLRSDEAGSADDDQGSNDSGSGSDDDEDDSGDDDEDSTEDAAAVEGDEEEGEDDESGESESTAGTPHPDGDVPIDPADQARFDDSPFGQAQRQDQIDAIDDRTGTAGAPDDVGGLDPDFLDSPVGAEMKEDLADGVEMHADGGATDPLDLEAEESNGPVDELKLQGGGVVDPVDDGGEIGPRVPTAPDDPTGGTPDGPGVPGGDRLGNEGDPADPSDPEGAMLTTGRAEAEMADRAGLVSDVDGSGLGLDGVELDVDTTVEVDALD